MYALGRRKLGRALGKSVGMSVIGILDYSGAEEHFKRMVQLANEARLEKVRARTSEHHDDLGGADRSSAWQAEIDAWLVAENLTPFGTPLVGADGSSSYESDHTAHGLCFSCVGEADQAAATTTTTTTTTSEQGEQVGASSKKQAKARGRKGSNNKPNPLAHPSGVEMDRYRYLLQKFPHRPWRTRHADESTDQQQQQQ
mgnify:FL=1